MTLKKEINWIYPEKKPIPLELIEFTDSQIIAEILVNRNITTSEEAALFINPEEITFSSPYSFKDMEKAVERIEKAIKNKEHILIYGDFDADGVTSTSLLWKTFKHLGADFSCYIPDRTTESHGLNSAAVCKLISGRKAKLIITVDCGISNPVEITLAKNLGVDVIVTDHHEAPNLLPPAVAIINPKVPDALDESLSAEQKQNLESLAGVGVAYKLAEALLDKFEQPQFKEEILHLVAIGTIADVMPILGENRGYVQLGLSLIEKIKPLGIIKLLETANYTIEKGISAETVAFTIAPRINAAGRLDSAMVAVELLTEEDSEKVALCAKKLDYSNRTRQQMCDTTFMEAEVKILRELDLAENKAIILAENNWHPGIIGIVASKIVEKYHRPVLLISVNKEKNEARCSARSVEGLHLYEVLCENSECFKFFGGHALAAGFCADLSVVNLEEIISNLNSTINKTLENIELQPILNVDADISPEDLTPEFMRKIDLLAPFGEGNPSPVFGMTDLSLRQFKTMGSANNHLKIFLSDSENNLLEAVWWSKNSLDIELLQPVKVAFSPKINCFADKKIIQLEVKDMKDLNPPQKTVELSTVPENEVPPAPIKWVDHRKKTGVEKSLLNYLKTAKDKISIFAEDRTIIENLQKNELFASKIINRNNAEKIDQLIFFDFPCNNEIFDKLIAKTNPKIVHLINTNQQNDSHINLIKHISGMLKFAHANKDGEVLIEELAVKLSTSVKVVNSCINLLNSSGVISLLKQEDEKIQFEFKKGADLSSMTKLSEFADFMKHVKETEEFRSKF